MATTEGSFPPAVILGVVGLERHAIYRQSLPPEMVKAMSAALMKLVAHEEPIQDMNSSVLVAAAAAASMRGWERSATRMRFTMRSSKRRRLANLDDRCAAAAMLDRLDYKNVKLDDAGGAEPLFAAQFAMFAAMRTSGQVSSRNSMPLRADRSKTSLWGKVQKAMVARWPANEIETYPRKASGRLIDLRTAAKGAADYPPKLSR